MEEDNIVENQDVKYIDYVKTKNNKIYYKSMYDSIRRYNLKNKEKINQKMKDRYHNDEEYKRKTLENAKRRYKMLKEQMV
jgi:hypothetical protein